MGAGALLIDHFSHYLTRSGDKQSRAWVFRDDVPSRFLRRPFSVGGDDFRINVIDRFEGRHPLLISHESLSREIQIRFRPTAILDSNIVSYLHQYVSGHSSISNERRRAVKKLLKFLVRNRLDYNPFFYFMEAASRIDATSLLAFSAPISESILRLHSMDAPHFLDCGEIRADPRILQIYRDEHGVNEFSELAQSFARRMIAPTERRMDWSSRLTYATLLKIALIHKTSSRGVRAKYEELKGFMEGTLNIALGVERILAIGYFAGRFEDFIPIQRGANAERMFKRVRAASWDLLLLTLPSFMLLSDLSDGVNLAYVCTCDKTLSVIARASRIDAVLAFAPDVKVPIPMISANLSIFNDDVGKNIVEQIGEIDAEWQRDRAGRLFSSEKHVGWDELESITKKLENDIASYCTS